VAMTEEVKVNVSGLLNLWIYQAAGGKGTGPQPLKSAGQKMPVCSPLKMPTR